MTARRPSIRPVALQPDPLRDAPLRRGPERSPVPEGVATAGDLRAAVLALAARNRAQWARCLMGEIVGAFWQAASGGLSPVPPPGDPGRVGDEVAGRARRYGVALAGRPLAEAAAAIGGLYTDLLPDDERARHGVFYTPAPLADRLVAQAEQAGVDWRTARVLDPAAGAAALLLPVARRMMAALADMDPGLALQNIGNRLRGWEMDPFAAWLGQVLLETALLPLVTASGRRLGPVMEVGDSLARPEVAAWDLVIGNPPFGRTGLSPDLRARFARSLYGHANLYGVFLDLAVRLAKPGGCIGFLTPSSFLGGEYFKKLRQTLADVAPPAVVDIVEDRKDVFDGVLQETVLATYRKAPPRPATVSIIRGDGAAGIAVLPVGTMELPASPAMPWILARHPEEAELAARLRRMPGRLADWGYRVSTGPLVWNRHKPQLGMRKTRGAVPVVWAESIAPDGRFDYRCQKVNHSPWFLPRPGDDWLIVRLPCVLLQRTTAKEQARRLIAAEMPAAFVAAHGGVTVENHVNMLIPVGARPAVSPTVLAAFLNSRAADRAFRCLSGSVAVSASELEALPLPPVSALRELKFLVADHVDRRHVEDVCNQLYGIDAYAVPAGSGAR